MSQTLRYSAARTFLASGNALFTSCDPEDEFRIKLERQLQKYSGRPVGILVRSGDELADLCSRNPFPDEPTSRVTALFTDGPLPSDPLEGVIGIHDERVCLGRRELFIFYPTGPASTKLHLPSMHIGTARNMSTIEKLAAMATRRL